jgi:plastocyanin
MLVSACSVLAPEIGALHAQDGGAAPVVDAGSGDARADSASTDAGRSDSGPMTFTVLVAPGDSHTFSPPTLAVRAGDTVRWVWEADGHTVTSGSGGNADDLFCSPSDGQCAGSPTSRAGSTYDHRFTTPGTFPYFCRPHVGSGMIGTIDVQ